MSARNGNKSRFGRQRKAKIRRRVIMRAWRKSLGAKVPKADSPQA